MNSLPDELKTIAEKSLKAGEEVLATVEGSYLLATGYLFVTSHKRFLFFKKGFSGYEENPRIRDLKINKVVLKRGILDDPLLIVESEPVTEEFKLSIQTDLNKLCSSLTPFENFKNELIDNTPAFNLNLPLEKTEPDKASSLPEKKTDPDLPAGQSSAKPIERVPSFHPAMPVAPASVFKPVPKIPSRPQPVPPRERSSFQQTAARKKMTWLVWFIVFDLIVTVGIVIAYMLFSVKSAPGKTAAVRQIVPSTQKIESSGVPLPPEDKPLDKATERPDSPVPEKERDKPLKDGPSKSGEGWKVGSSQKGTEGSKRAFPEKERDKILKQRISSNSGRRSAGISKMALQRVMQSKRNQFVKCKRAGSTSPIALVLSFEVTPEGRVQNERIRSTVNRDEQVEACVLGVLQATRFPKTGQDQNMKVTFPVIFR